MSYRLHFNESLADGMPVMYPVRITSPAVSYPGSSKLYPETSLLPCIAAVVTTRR